MKIETTYTFTDDEIKAAYDKFEERKSLTELDLLALINGAKKWIELKEACQKDPSYQWGCGHIIYQKGVFMTFVAHVKYWAEYLNDGSGDYKNVSCFIVADSFSEVVNIIMDYYGKDYVEKLSIETFGPDQMLEFDDNNIDESYLFNEIYNQLAPKQIW